MSPMAFDRERARLSSTMLGAPLAANNSRALGEMEGAAAGFKELYEEYKELLKEEKAGHAATKEELKATKEELKAAKAELDQLKAASAKRPAEAAASPPATKQRLSEGAPPPGPPGGGFKIFPGGNGSFTTEENEAYRALLKLYGQPAGKNPQPWAAAFGQVFPNRTLPSLAAHVNAFNKSEYDDWRKTSGVWHGFDWRLIKLK